MIPVKCVLHVALLVIVPILSFTGCKSTSISRECIPAQMVTKRRRSALSQRRWSRGFSKRCRAAQVDWEGKRMKGSWHGATTWQQVCFQLDALNSQWTALLPWHMPIPSSLWQLCCFPTDQGTWGCQPSFLIWSKDIFLRVKSTYNIFVLLCFIYWCHSCWSLLSIPQSCTGKKSRRMTRMTTLTTKNQDSHEAKRDQKMHTKRFLSLTLRTLWLFLLPLGRSQLKSYFAGLVDGVPMDEEDDDDERKRDSAEMLLHEFVYKLKNYFMESERALRVPGLLIFLFLRILSHNG